MLLHALIFAAVLLLGILIALQMWMHQRWSTWAEGQTQRLNRLEVESAVRGSSAPPPRYSEPPLVERLRSPLPAAWRLPPPPVPRRPLSMMDMPPEPFPLSRRADWGDDRAKTRRMDQGETYLPIDFRHDLW